MEEDIKIIEDFLRGDLSSQDKQNVFRRLEKDKAFRAKYELEKQLFDAFNEDHWSQAKPNTPQVDTYREILQDKDIQDLKKTLHQFQQSEQPKPKKDFKLNKTILYVAASVILLLVLFQVFLNQSPSNSELYYQHANLDDLPSFVTRSDSNEDKLIRAEQLFEEKEYKQSISLLEEALVDNKNDSRIYLYLGAALLEMNEFEKAEEVYDQLINSNLLDAQKGYWYKALVYLKMDDLTRANEQLKDIVKNDYYNKIKAEELIEQLDRIL